MPELSPLGFSELVSRMLLEWEREQKIFDLPASKFWYGPSDKSLNMGVRFHGRPAGTPLGPAAGPQTQMAQNIVLAWLGGARIIELKTVQINDRLTIGRPCIDATNVGYNIEFSQELLLEQSLKEYVKAWLMIRMLEEAEVLGVKKRSATTPPDAPPHFYDTVFDLSCGYNFAGITSEKVQWFIRSLVSAEEMIERLLAKSPADLSRFSDIRFDPKIVHTATLSTFHGCPANEIEKIVDHLVRVNRLHTVIKMNPTMLGHERINEILHNEMGYEELAVNPHAFENGLQFDDSILITRRLRHTAHEAGLGVGAKFSNTLEVLNHRDFFSVEEKVMYMSGAPLHPLAMELSLRYREAYLKACEESRLSGDLEEQEDGYVPISFSAGVDKTNFPLCVAAGFVPATTCTDLLKPGGYGRSFEYLRALEQEMTLTSSPDIDTFIRNYGGGSGSSEPLGAVSLSNHRQITEATVKDSRYGKARNSLVPKRINSKLVIFDCITCDKCIPVCPNDANFTYNRPATDFIYYDYECGADGKAVPIGPEKALKLTKARQIANYGPFCNECGNCDTFCPEYGGPFIEKPTFFSSLREWQDFTAYDGFCIVVSHDQETICGRMRGQEFTLTVRTDDTNSRHLFSSTNGEVEIDPVKLLPVACGNTTGYVDMTTYLTLRILLTGVLHDSRINYLNIPVSPG